jgi:nucleoid-associated protein YgaU
MPRKKNLNQTKNKSVGAVRKSPKIRWGESYTSLVLGALVVIVATILIFTFIRGRGMIGTGVFDFSPNATSEKQSSAGEKEYTVEAGDNLWSIAEREYGSGYNWVDIASSNNLADPNLISEGTNLTIPDVPKKTEDAQDTLDSQDQSNFTSIATNSYTVNEGDCLWNIAVRAYGDGYRWTEIAAVNNLANPDLIYSGDTIKIPR